MQSLPLERKLRLAQGMSCSGWILKDERESALSHTGGGQDLSGQGDCRECGRGRVGWGPLEGSVEADAVGKGQTRPAHQDPWGAASGGDLVVLWRWSGLHSLGHSK